MSRKPLHDKGQNTLWIVTATHGDVPGEHLLMLCQPTEPTEKQVRAVYLSFGHLPSDVKLISVSRAFDMQFWLSQFNNQRALAEFIADGGMEAN